MSKKVENILRKTLYVHKEILDDEKNGALYRWNNKEIKDKVLLYNGDTLENIIASSCAELSLSNEVSDCSLKLKLSTDIENVIPRPWPSVRIKLGGIDLTKYNRIACNIYIKSTGYQNHYFQFSLGNAGSMEHHSPSLDPNKWNYCTWEVEDVLRDKCEELVIGPWLMGTPPEGLPSYEIFIDSVYAEVVDADYVEGWKLDNRIAYSHAGYFKDSKKIALTGVKTCDKFEVLKDNNIVLSKDVKEVKSELGLFYEMDFSELNDDGTYVIKYGNQVTGEFEISDNSYDESIWKSMNFLRLLRCGEDIPGVHSACHLNCRSMHPDGSSVPNFGGWHDAGDVSQFEIPTAEMAHAILDLALAVKDTDNLLYERLIEEARVGINWLLRTRFGDGMRALAITYSIWRKNVLKPDNKTVYSNVAENGPFENFCASAALAKAYLVYKDEDLVFANWCLRSAKEDFEFAKIGYEQGIYTKRWGPNIDSQVCGHGIIAAVELYKCTLDFSYIDIAASYAKVVLACQQSTDPDWDIPLKGFFYEDPMHKWMLTYEHRGHEQSPVQGLCMLCDVAKGHVEYPNWIKGVKLYREYVLESMKLTYPYGLVPGHVYVLDKLNSDRFTIPASYGTIPEGMEILRNQARSGKKLAEGVYLRIFPIAVQRRGYHATLLSKTKAISLIANVLNDQELKQIAIDQLEWVMGKNPFASSTMYGCGYNYHPLYVAFSRQMVGALPVGIMTKGDSDMPYWPVRDHAVFKEIWGHTTGKYLWVLADLIKK